MPESKKNKITLLHVFKTLIRPRIKLLLLGLFLIIINRVAGLVLPGASKYLMDDVIANGDLETLKVILFAVVGAILVQSISSFLLTLLLSVEAQHLIAKMRVQVQEKILKLPKYRVSNNMTFTGSKSKV